jgi:hypothetical protein
MPLKGRERSKSMTNMGPQADKSRKNRSDSLRPPNTVGIFVEDTPSNEATSDDFDKFIRDPSVSEGKSYIEGSKSNLNVTGFARSRAVSLVSYNETNTNQHHDPNDEDQTLEVPRNDRLNILRSHNEDDDDENLDFDETTL